MFPVDRRNLLRAAVAAPAVPLLAGAPATAAPRAREDRFTIAVLPDTQYLFDADSADPAPLRETLRYLLEERAAVFLAHLGDLTEHGTPQEIALASEAFRAIDGKLPYRVVAANPHVPATSDDRRGNTAFRQAFGPQRFAGTPAFLGASPDGYNSAHTFEAGGRLWMVLALDWRTSEAGFLWAQGVIDGNPRVPVIVTTHDLAYPDHAGRAALSTYGVRLWDRLIRDNDQIFLTLNGHHWPSARTVLTNAAGHPVHVHVTNYQERYYGGAAMIRLYTFDLARNLIEVETFSPWLLARDPAGRTALEAETAELTGPDDRFTMTVDFAARFAGFDPPAAPAPRSAAALVDRHTIAYWRFDTPGQTVTEGATVRDQTGNGNDLRVRRLATGGPDVLTLSADHHPDLVTCNQPKRPLPTPFRALIPGAGHRRCH